MIIHLKYTLALSEKGLEAVTVSDACDADSSEFNDFASPSFNMAITSVFKFPPAFDTTLSKSVQCRVTATAMCDGVCESAEVSGNVVERADIVSHVYWTIESAREKLLKYTNGRVS